MTPLTYLWQRDRSELINEIIDNGFYAILVKVAGAGLVPQRHLGKDLQTLLPVLHQLHMKVGLDLCGEGGEYETLVLDCPLFLNSRIVLDLTEIVLDSEDSSLGNLVVKEFHLENKSPIIDMTDEIYSIRNNCLRKNKPSYSMKETMLTREAQLCISQENKLLIKALDSPTADSNMVERNQTKHAKPTVQIHVNYNDGCGHSELCLDSHTVTDTMANNVPDTTYDPVQSRTSQIHIQLNNIFRSIRSSIAEMLASCSATEDGVNGYPMDVEINRAMSDVCFVHVYLSSISLFADVNAVYALYFGSLPPSRSTIVVSTEFNKRMLLLHT